MRTYEQISRRHVVGDSCRAGLHESTRAKKCRAFPRFLAGCHKSPA